MAEERHWLFIGISGGGGLGGTGWAGQESWAGAGQGCPSFLSRPLVEGGGSNPRPGSRARLGRAAPPRGEEEGSPGQKLRQPGPERRRLFTCNIYIYPPLLLPPWRRSTRAIVALEWTRFHTISSSTEFRERGSRPATARLQGKFRAPQKVFLLTFWPHGGLQGNYGARAPRARRISAGGGLRGRLGRNSPHGFVPNNRAAWAARPTGGESLSHETRSNTRLCETGSTLERL